MKSAGASLADRVPGIQLAIFELVWPAFVWIDRVSVRREGKLCRVTVESKDVPAAAERTDCETILGEVLDAGLADTGLRYELVFSQSPSTGEVQELMSTLLFKKIAADVAPWRLESGR